MRSIRKPDGFKNEFLFVFPNELLSRFLENNLFKFLMVTDIGYFPFAEYHFRKRPKGCETAVFLYCSAGTGFYSIDGQDSLPLSSGQLVIIPPNTPHVYGASEQSPWSVYWAHVRGSFFEPYYEKMRRYLPIKVTDVMGAKFQDLFRQCFGLLKSPYQYEEYFYLCQLVGAIFALAACSGKESEVQLTVNSSRGVDRALAFMKNHLHQMISLKELTEAAGLSSSHLHYLFKRSTGNAPIEYFLQTKIHAASRDLYFSNLPIKDIAISYGIEDPYYFSRLFKRIMGVSPLKYRSQTKG